MTSSRALPSGCVGQAGRVWYLEISSTVVDYWHGSVHVLRCHLVTWKRLWNCSVGQDDVLVVKRSVKCVPFATFQTGDGAMHGS